MNFRLLTEYHSFLSTFMHYVSTDSMTKFPSPYGVSFILMGGHYEKNKKY